MISAKRRIFLDMKIFDINRFRHNKNNSLARCFSSGIKEFTTALCKGVNAPGGTSGVGILPSAVNGRVTEFLTQRFSAVFINGHLTFGTKGVNALTSVLQAIPCSPAMNERVPEVVGNSVTQDISHPSPAVNNSVTQGFSPVVSEQQRNNH